jgi:hypothetical protein
MVEIEIGVLVGQCLDRRIETHTRLVAETAAWEKRRNAERARINWMFTKSPAGPIPSPPSHQTRAKNLCDEVLVLRGAITEWA